MTANRLCVRLFRLYVCFHAWALPHACTHPAGAQPHPAGPGNSAETPSYSLTESMDTALLRKQIREGQEKHWKSGDSMLYYFRRLLLFSRRQNYREGICSAANSIGRWHLQNSEYQKAVEMLLLSVRHAPESREGYELTASGYNNIANAYSSLEQPFFAAQYYYLAAEVANRYLDGYGIEYIYSNLSVCLPRLEYAVYYLEKAEAIARKKGNDSLLCIILSNKSVAYQETGRKSGLVLKALEEALALSRELANPLYQYRILIRLGAFYFSLNNAERALDYLKKAAALNPEGERDMRFRNRDLQLLGGIYLKLHEFEHAKSHFMQSRDIASRMNLLQQEAQAYYHLAEIAGMEQQHAQAFAHLKQHILLNDSFIRQQSAKDIYNLEVRYRTSEKEMELVRKEREIEKRNMWLLGISSVFGILFSAGFGYFRHLRQKQRMLRQHQEILQLKAIMQGEEIERKRIARELHDGIMILFSSVKMNISATLKRMPPAPYKPELARAVSQLDEATAELRKSAHKLMPDMLLREGLAAAVQYFCRSVSIAGGTQVLFQHYGPAPSMTPEYELMLYRIIQELVQNALKHAAATDIIVQIDNNEGLLTLTVEDNGSGFDTAEAGRPGGSGLSGIRSRIDSLGGKVEIQSGAGTGTTVYVELDTKNMQPEGGQKI